MHESFESRVERLTREHEALLGPARTSQPGRDNGIYTRYRYPVLTDQHTPLAWRYDFNPQTNPFFMQRQGINGVFNPGAIELDGKIYLVCRVEGWDRKSFFAVAESADGINGFRFWDEPVVMPETDDPDTNVYDMRVVKHEDGWIYGIFCTERKDKTSSDLSAATAQAGIARTRDLRTWERLPDLKTKSPQQRNVVLHPEFVGGQVRVLHPAARRFHPGGQRWRHRLGAVRFDGPGSDRLGDRDRAARLPHDQRVQERRGSRADQDVAGLAAPRARGARHCGGLALRALPLPERPGRTVACDAPAGGYFMAPQGEERVGDVSNVLFANGWVARADGSVYIYYASSDTRIHVATSTVDQLLDYVTNTPEDGLRTAASVQARLELIRRNRAYLQG